MSEVKHRRTKKRQLGQFLTPAPVAERIVARHSFHVADRVLEPGFGAGAFLFPLIERFLALRDGDLDAVLTENLWGIELDPELHARTLDEIRTRFGRLPERHNLTLGDFLLEAYPERTVPASRGELFAADGFFDLVIGNPPFGATVSIPHQDELDRRYGFRGGLKIKKESYSFFIVKALELLRRGGRLEVICSDTFLTIATMKGLRKLLLDNGDCRVLRLDEFSPETSYNMVVLQCTKGDPADHVLVEDERVLRSDCERTRNFSWRASGELTRFFDGPTLGDFVVATSGMTTGKNDYFVREIVDGAVLEPYEFVFFDDPITVENELHRARLNKLSAKQLAKIHAQQGAGATRRNVRLVPRARPVRVELPHPHYRYYNKAVGDLVYSVPRHAIYWEGDGDAVRTFKANGRWYLHGVGGAPFFGREGLTWQLVAARLNVRYLPSGYILDSGAPIAVLRDGVDPDELWFILGWTLTEAASRILKGALNHTMNIQSKDLERLPYPAWVGPRMKSQATAHVRRLVEAARSGTTHTRESEAVLALEALYALPMAAMV